MTKKEVTRVLRDLERLTIKLGKKRDEMREILTDIEALVESVEEADEGMAEVITHLSAAKRALDREVVDKLSQYA